MSNAKNKYTFSRKAGILMPVSSLPSPYGIGSFGKGAFDFADFVAESGNKYWQLLPLNPTSYGDSPYQSPAAAAGNPLFLDLDILNSEGLLTKKELRPHKTKNKKVDYGHLFETRYSLLRLAHTRFVKKGGEEKQGYKSFLKKNKSWIFDYALFMSLKVKFNYSAWTSWPEEYKNSSLARKNADAFKEECAFWLWVQYEFDREWQALRSYANKKGIKIIGDMPIYVAHDSLDVWMSPDEFLLDESYNPTVVAGCPPDGFSPDGQLWGNPIYNWEKMKSDGFSWWLKRVKESFRLYDVLRIDHFRGFAGYYNIPFGHETAREGKWDSAPGIELFRAVKAAFPKSKIIAEDLGFITDDVRELLLDTGFPGMKMLQFAFFDDDSEYLPRMFKDRNCVVYSGSHDSDCTRSFISELSGDTRKRFNRECPHKKGQSRTFDLIDFALGSSAALAIIPIQDYLELKNEDGRMNTPSVAEGNWTWRISPRYNSKALAQKISSMIKESKRT